MRPTTSTMAATAILIALAASTAAFAKPVYRVTIHTDLRHKNMMRDDADFRYIILDPPNSAFTEARSINLHGQIVGFYRPYGATSVVGFSYYQNNYSPIAPNGATNVYPLRINNLGTIVGTATSPDGRYHGFVIKGTQFEIIEDPAAANTVITGINDKEEIVGYSFDTSDVATSFAGSVNSTELKPLDSQSWIWDLDNSEDTVGFRYKCPGYAPKDNAIGQNADSLRMPREDPLTSESQAEVVTGHSVNDVAIRGTSKAYGINNKQDVVGTYSDPHGFLIHQGQIYTFDVPGSNGIVGTQAFGIDDAGRIVGVYQEPTDDSRGEALHGFLAIPHQSDSYSQVYVPRTGD